MSAPARITSLTNARIKAIRALEMRKTRRETGLFVAEGASVLIAAREAGHRPETVLLREDDGCDDQLGMAAKNYVAWAQAEGSQVLCVSHPVLAKLAGKDNPQTILGVFKQTWSDVPPRCPIGSNDVVLVLEEVRDPGNLGTIIRTADAVGVARIILLGTCCDPFQRECVRATMGSVFAVPLHRVATASFAQWHAGWPGDTLALHLEGSQDFRAQSYRRPTMVVMGGEGPGLSDATTALCNLRVRIPMAGRLDSLNLAVATALTLYEVRRGDL